VLVYAHLHWAENPAKFSTVDYLVEGLVGGHRALYVQSTVMVPAPAQQADAGGGVGGGVAGVAGVAAPLAGGEGGGMVDAGAPLPQPGGPLAQLGGSIAQPGGPIGARDAGQLGGTRAKQPPRQGEGSVLGPPDGRVGDGAAAVVAAVGGPDRSPAPPPPPPVAMVAETTRGRVHAEDTLRWSLQRAVRQLVHAHFVGEIRSRSGKPQDLIQRFATNLSLLLLAHKAVAEFGDTDMYELVRGLPTSGFNMGKIPSLLENALAGEEY
jgi:hypothetical protein